MPGFFLALDVQMIPTTEWIGDLKLTVKMVHVQSAKIGTIEKNREQTTKTNKAS